MTNQQRPSARIDIGLIQRQRLGDPQTTAPQHRDQRANPKTVAILAVLAHDQDDLLRPRRVRRVLHALVRRAAGEVPRPGGR
jgi:hypothetical protein